MGKVGEGLQLVTFQAYLFSLEETFCQVLHLSLAEVQVVKIFE